VPSNSVSVVVRPVKKVKGFAKVLVPAGKLREVKITIPIEYAVSVWNKTANL
jgi:hypothetical protein